MRVLKLFLIILVAFFVGCSSTPKRGDTVQKDPIKASSKEAQAQFDAALAALERGEFDSADEQFRLLQAEYPNDPIAQVAELYLARAGLRNWESTPAAEYLSVFAGLADDTNVDSRIRFAAAVYLAGSTMVDRDAAMDHLKDYPGPSLSPAVLKRDRLMAWSVLTEAFSKAGRRADAIHALSKGFNDSIQAEEGLAFQSYARARAFNIVQQLSSSELAEMVNDRDSVFLRAVAGYELVRRGEGADIETRVRGELVSIGANEKAQSLKPPKAEVKPSVVGIVVPTTGANAAVGKRALNAAMLAVGAIGQPRGNTTLKVVDANQPAEAIKTQLGDAIAFVGPLDQGQAAELAPWARDEQKVMLAPVAKLPTPVETTWAFRNFISPELEPVAIAKAAVSAGTPQVVILRPNIGYGTKMATAFTEALVAAGGEVVAEYEYDRASTDYTDLAKKVAKLKPQAVFIPDTDQKVAEVTAFLANANIWGRSVTATRKSKRIEVVYLGTSLWQRPDLIRRAGTYVAGAIIPVWSSSAFDTPQTKRFFGEYAEVYGDTPGDIEAFVFDSVALLRSTLEDQGLSEPESLRAAMQGQASYTGVTGAARFDIRGEPLREPRLVEIAKGTFVPFEPSPVDPQ